MRAFDARMQMAQRQGKTSFYMQHMGEEAVSCAFRVALEPGDMNFPTSRQAGLLIADSYNPSMRQTLRTVALLLLAHVLRVHLHSRPTRGVDHRAQVVRVAVARRG